MEIILFLLLGLGLSALVGSGGSDTSTEPSDTSGEPVETDVPTDGNDKVTLTGLADVFDGGLGNDSIDGRAGFDKLSGGAGDDTLHGGLGKDVLDGGPGADELFGENWNDTLYGGDGNDDLFGGSSKDTLFGGDGIDLLDGGDARDELFGGADRDFLTGGDGVDLLEGGDGNDVLLGGENPSTPLDSEPHSLENPDLVERIYGGAGNDFLLGGAGEDRLEGGEGDDILIASDFATISDEVLPIMRGEVVTPTAPILVFNEEAGVDTDDEVLFGGNGDDLLALGGDDVAFGGNGEDTFLVGIDWIGNDGTHTASIVDFDINEDVLVIGYDADDGPPALSYRTDLYGRIFVSANGAEVAAVQPADGPLTELELAAAIQVAPINAPDGR